MKKLLLAVIITLCAFPASGSYTQQFALGQDSTFQGQVAVAMQISAANVMTEAATIAGHIQRAAFAKQVIQTPSVWNPIIAQFISAQTNNAMTPLTVPSTVLDSLIQTAMDAQWSNMSGYFKQ